MPEVLEIAEDLEGLAGILQIWEEIERLKAKNQELEVTIESLRQEVYSKNELRCQDFVGVHHRVKALEIKNIATAKAQYRLADLERFLRGKPGHRATFEEIRGHLNIRANQLSALLKALKSRDPYAVDILRSSNHKKKILVWKRSFQIEVK